ncbi:MAG: hypothetical protein ACKVQB_05980 [Bacteroidia bacterium]
MKSNFDINVFKQVSTLLIVLFVHSCFAQNLKTKKSPVKITGDFGLYGDFYNMKSDTVGAVAPRRPDFLGRAVINASLDIKKFSLPITLSLASGQFGVILPNIPNPAGLSFKDFKNQFKNPLNRFGIAPKYKWCQVLLGSQIPHYSELSVGDLAVFGAGINLTPGKFRFSIFGGTSQLAVESDSVKKIQGIYARKIYSAKIGLGHEDSSHLYLIGSMMKDDTASIKVNSLNPMAQTGILSSLDFRLNLSKKLYIKGEVAGSVFTRDVSSDELPAFTPTIPKEIFNPKISSRADYASIVSIGGDWKYFGIKTTGRYYGDGFVPLGYPFMQTDRLEVTIDPRFMLFKNKVQFSGSIGRRVNNLSGIRAATTTQTIGSANLNLQFTESLSLAASYSNFGFRNSITNDTFKMEMVTQSWSVNPSYSYTGKGSIHNFSILYSQNAFTDFNTISGAINNNDAVNGAFSYTVSMLKKPLSVSTMLSYFENHTSFGKLLTQSANASVGYKFFKKKLSTNLGLTVADNKVNAMAAGLQTMATLGAKYTLKKKIQFSLNGSLNLFDYKESRPGISYRENLLRTSVTYKF